MVRAHQDAVTWIAWLFPNTYAVDPIRDLVLFNTWPMDFGPVVLKLVGFAVIAIAAGSFFSVLKLRRIS
jgi:ABC-type multidrug transport system permease subunit